MSGARNSGYSRSGNLASAKTHARELSCSGESFSGRVMLQDEAAYTAFLGVAYGDPGIAILAWIAMGLRVRGQQTGEQKLAKAYGLLSFVIRRRNS